MMYFNGDRDEVNSYADDWPLCLRLVLRYNLQFSDGQRRNFSAEGPTHVLSPRGSILHTLFYLIFITAAQWKETREKRTCFFILFCLDMDNVRITVTLRRVNKQDEERKRKDWMSGIICTIYLFFIFFKS